MIQRDFARGSTRLAWLAFSLLLLGCESESETDRLKRMVPNAHKTTKISGKVTVNGEPVKDLWVTLHAVDPNMKDRPVGRTDADGNFIIATYSGGDGAPEGEWNITIEWLTHQRRNNEWVGPDKLKDQYNKPDSTPFKVTVGKEPIILPPYELKVEGVDVKPDPKKVNKYKRDR
jgi:hypothetical protein